MTIFAQVPALLVRVPLEGTARAFLVCQTLEDELALLRHLARRDLLFELALAIDELRAALAAEDAA